MLETVKVRREQAIAKQIKWYLETNNSPKNTLEWSQASLAELYLFLAELLKRRSVPDTIAATLEKQNRTAKEEPICFAAVRNI